MPSGRVALSKIIDGRIKWTPEAEGYRLDMRLGLGSLFSGLVGVESNSAWR